MPSIRAPLSKVLSTVRKDIQQEAAQAAGANKIISRAEQARLQDDVTRGTADELRTAGGPGATVTVDALVEGASSRMASLLGTVNQPSGAGSTSITPDEVKALAAAHPGAGVRVARAYELITGRKVDLVGVVPPGPTTDPSATWPLASVRARAQDLLVTHLHMPSGGNQQFSAAERAALPDGILKNAAAAVGTPCTSRKITAEVMRQLDEHLRAVGVPSTSATVTDVHVAKLLARNPELAGLLADAMAEERGPRLDTPGLPAARFMLSDPSPPADPTLTGPVLTGVPGAAGVVRTLDPARLAATVGKLHVLIDAMDLSRTGTISLAEAESFVKRAGGGYIWDPHVPPENRPRTLERMLFDVREDAYQRLRRSPTPSDVKEQLARTAARAVRIGVDFNNSAFDARGPVRFEDEPAAVILFDTARAGSVELDAEPLVRFFDHEGDWPVEKRRALDLSGPPEQAIRTLVFHFNKAGNDNHWPLWSGRATSRYRLDAEETAAVVARIRAEPPARRAELFQAMVDWLSQPGNPGLLYVNTDARHLVDALAVELGHAYRSPTGETTAPSMPSP